MGIAHVTLVGNIGFIDEQTKVGDKEILKFTLYANTKKTEFKQCYYVTAWGNRAVYGRDKMQVGATVTVIGNLVQDAYEKDGQQRISMKVDAIHIYGKAINNEDESSILSEGF